jgi:hypothetical protein
MRNHDTYVRLQLMACKDWHENQPDIRFVSYVSGRSLSGRPQLPVSASLGQLKQRVGLRLIHMNGRVIGKRNRLRCKIMIEAGSKTGCAEDSIHIYIYLFISVQCTGTLAVETTQMTIY